ncbi:MAG: hypothetical protein EHM78_27035 [Myxococcaceae bacterium]|nr:MAG: hypothetical protein EHM78_27035 [Myxococcaceae bacterium]
MTATTEDATRTPVDIADLLARARAAGLRVRVIMGDRLQLSGPPLPELRRELSARQADVLAALRAEADAALVRLAAWRPLPERKPPGAPWPGQQRPPEPQRRLPFKHGNRRGR